jgi:glycosyltransferase involved in cell wall biosynthesis
MLTAIGRVHHRQYRESANLSNLLGCVPYGLCDEAPLHTRPAIRGADTAFAGAIAPTDTVLLWGGGIWNWFDPCAVIRAIANISHTRQDIKLVFLASTPSHSTTTHLNVAYAADQAYALSRELGVYNCTVFFNESWVPYTERQNFLLEADIGVSTHFDTLETEFSFRTRILDYLWAELPILATSGDYFGELVQAHQLGLTVLPRDVSQLKAAILKLADDHAFVEQCKANIRKIRPTMTWSRIIQPLEVFCKSPYRTSRESQPITALYLLRLYAASAKLLVQHRGYRKIMNKLFRYFSRKIYGMKT